MENLGKRFEKSTGFTILGDLTQIILDSDRLSDYDGERVVEVVEMSAEFFYDRYVQIMLDKMADTLRGGFEEVDREG